MANENLEEKLPIIRGRILGILFKAEKGPTLEEDEIIDIYLENWPGESEKLIVQALQDLVWRGYVITKITYGRNFYWLSPKGKKFVLGVIAGGSK
jgi:DNA-binding PadR family transcriptional regulator